MSGVKLRSDGGPDLFNFALIARIYGMLCPVQIKRTICTRLGQNYNRILDRRVAMGI
jgi:hypothetical protein